MGPAVRLQHLCKAGIGTKRCSLDSQQAHPPATNEAFPNILLLQKINALPSNQSNSPSSCSQSAVLHENHSIYS